MFAADMAVNQKRGQNKDSSASTSFNEWMIMSQGPILKSGL